MSAVQVVWRRDRKYKIDFPNRARAERWLLARDPELWEIVPIDDDDDDDEALDSAADADT